VRATLYLGAALSWPALAQAAQLQPPVVACLTLRDAQTYQSTVKTQPEFANDLLARAACYQLAELADARPLGRPTQGFQKYQLLSGHGVWLPVDAR
jgi:hypothetical protein